MFSPDGPGGRGRGAAGKASAPYLAGGAPAGWRGRGVASPEEVYVALRVDDVGAPLGAAGPFLDRAGAAAHAAREFGGRGRPCRSTWCSGVGCL
jgi:hypothetical protein